MKLVRYGETGREKPGLIDVRGALRDLSGQIAGIGWDEISDAGRARLASIDVDRLPVVRGKPRLGVPFTGISKIVGIGLNYRAHAIEAGMPIPCMDIISSASNPDFGVLCSVLGTCLSSFLRPISFPSFISVS